jgi:hypothetical protein
VADAPSITHSQTGINDDNVVFGANQTELDRLDMQHKCIHDAYLVWVCVY